RPLTPEVLDALVVRADGVPLFVEELTKAVAAPGAARGVEAVPATLADSLMARLGRLARGLEGGGAAGRLGEGVSDGVLAGAAGLEEDALGEGLERLVEAEVVFERGEPPQATYVFQHALLQEVAYESLLKRTRQQLHTRVAQALETQFADRTAAQPEIVARHYHAAGLLESAIAHYQRAGTQAAARSADEEAVAA